MGEEKTISTNIRITRRDHLKMRIGAAMLGCTGSAFVRKLIREYSMPELDRIVDAAMDAEALNCTSPAIRESTPEPPDEVA